MGNAIACDPPVTNHTDPNLNSTYQGSNKLKNVLITKEILALYDKYEGEFGLMDERWADKRDSDKITSKQAHLFSQYIYNLRVIKNKHYSDQLKDKAMNENAQIELVMDDEVGRTLRERERHNEHPVS